MARSDQGHITEQKYGGVFLRRDGRHTGTEGWRQALL
jgi:hypothetical protein